MTIERVELTPEQYWETVERARVLSRLVAKDPSDLDARLSLALLRRDGFDVEDPAWVLGFTPPQPSTPTEPEATSVPHCEVTGDEFEWFVGGQSKLEGAAYFRFFAWLMLGTTVLYLPFALIYRPKTYLQD